ncbi:DUF7402 domain-containing protein [Frigoribacterium sp. 2-23]|uniref:DUF7402 domain-containing protein n=1 Tax=Frigoribacterium sp. 2-23 TaxID=3415006 RepID=UPI003C6FC5EC
MTRNDTTAHPSRRASSRWRRVVMILAVGVIAVVGASGFVGGTGSASAATACAAGTSLNVLAHQDDDLLFESKNLVSDLTAGKCVTTVYVTAGDAGRGTTYWKSREQGAQAAYAKMLGVTNSWTTSTTKLNGKSIGKAQLKANTGVNLIFLRLPDGGLDGNGFAATGHTSLPQLYQGVISSISTVDGLSSYTLATLKSQLLSIMTTLKPTAINTLDYKGPIDDGDHPDHHTVGYIVQTVQAGYTTPHTFAGYMGYPIAALPSNLTSAQIAAKSSAFYAYAAKDNQTCGSDAACYGHPEADWMSREYLAGSTAPTTPTDPTTPTQPSVPSTQYDVTAGATATASSQNTADDQTAAKAIDGVKDGYPGVATREWATVGGGSGSWLNLTWSAARSVDQVVLYDRPNTDDQITSGTLTFSDGSTVAVPTLANSGTATTVSFTARSTTSIRLTVTGVSATTRNVGLSEIVVNSADAPSGTTPTQPPTQPVQTDVTTGGVATASSENPTDGQTAAKAIDGVADGYPGVAAHEWATVGGGAGSWLTVTWAQAKSVDQVVLYDRPNTDDQITGGTLTFSDGSTVSVPTLDNAGGAVTVSFAARSTTSVRLTVTSVSGTTRNVGLAELRVFGAS